MMFDVGSLVIDKHSRDVFEIIDYGKWVTTSNEVLCTIREKKTGDEYVIKEDTLEELYVEYNMWKNLEKALENGYTK